MKSNITLPSYGNIAFWAWNKNMSNKRIKHQIDEFSKQGHQGFFIHARAGLTIPYLGEEWMSSVAYAINQAKRHNMTVWLYDEYGWPSGFAGGIVPNQGEEFWLKHLVFKKGLPQATHLSNILATYQKDTDTWKRVPINSLNKNKETLTVAYDVDKHYVDLLYPKTTRKFIESTHEQYYKLFGDEFGKTIKGIFTDEPQVFHASRAWSPVIRDIILNNQGYDILDKLYLLLEDNQEAEDLRYDYFQAINSAFHANFVEPLAKWCADHKIDLTGHFSAEDGLVNQIADNAGVMAMYPTFQIPSIDFLGKRLPPIVLLKQVESIKNQFRKPYILSETFGCSGWSSTIADYTWLWGYQAAHGVNLATLHGTMFSIKGIRKRDYPAFFSYQSSWWNQIHYLFDWMKNINTFLSSGDVYHNVLVLNPIRDLWRKRYMTAHQIHLSNQYRVLLEALKANQLDFDLADESLLETYGFVRNNRIGLKERDYKILIVPEMHHLEPSTEALLKKFISKGGKVYFANQIPIIKNDELKQIISETGVIVQNRAAMWHKYFENNKYNRKIAFYSRDLTTLSSSLSIRMVHKKDNSLCYVLNESKISTENMIGKYSGKKHMTRINILTKEHLPIHYWHENNVTYFELSLEAMESCLLSFSNHNSKRSIEHAVSKQKVNLTVLPIKDNTFTIDRCRYRVDNGVFSDELFVLHAESEIYQASEKAQTDLNVIVRYEFFLEDLPKSLNLNLETEDIDFVICNGTQLSSEPISWFIDYDIHAYDITSKVKKGVNTIDVKYSIPYIESDFSVNEVFETERNRFKRPVEIESVYLTGDFDVNYNKGKITKGVYYTLSDGEFVLTKQIDKNPHKDLSPQGLWFYRGQTEYIFHFTCHNGDDYVLELEHFSAPVAEVYVNNTLVGAIVTPPYRVSLSTELREGNNIIKIVVQSSNRNLLGPHHHYKKDPVFVGPSTFNGIYGFEDFVNFDAQNITWRDAYHFIEFKLGTVWLVKNEISE